MKQPHAKSNMGIDHPVYAIAKEAQWDNAQLIVRALAGDPVAENALYRRHARYLLNLATRLTRSVSDGDDVVQDTFVLAFRKLKDLDDPNALLSWLTRILITRIRRTLRARRLRAFFGFKQLEETATLQMCATHNARPDLRAELGKIDVVLQKMPSEWRTTWMLHRIEELSIQETSDATNRSVSTVKRYVAAVDSAIQSRRRLAL